MAMPSSRRCFAAGARALPIRRLVEGGPAAKLLYDALRHGWRQRAAGIASSSGRRSLCAHSRILRTSRWSSSDARAGLEGDGNGQQATESTQPYLTGSGRGPDQHEPKERLEVLPIPTERSIREGSLVLFLPWMTAFSRWNMLILNQAFSGAFDFNEFRAGATNAFLFVHAALCEGNRDQLHDLLSSDLLSKIFQDAHSGVRGAESRRYELHEVQFQGLPRAWVSSLPDGDSFLKVQACFYVEEDVIVDRAQTSGDAQPEAVRYRQRRLHSWTFERPLDDDAEQPGDWSVVDMDKLVWPPECAPP